MIHTYRRTIYAAALLVALAAGCTKISSEQEDPATKTGAQSASDKAGAESASDKAGAESASDNAAQGAAALIKGAPPPGSGANMVPPSELEYVEMTVSVDAATGDPKEDNFRYFKVWGELTNKSSSWVESIAGDIRFFDANGKELAIRSVGTAMKQDLGDSSPGERFSSDVMYIAPGASVPVHHIRALAKLGGKYGSHKVTLRPARIVTTYPDIAIEGLQDQVANVANEALPNASPKEHRVISATLRNKGTLGCRNPQLVVGYYDASGKLAYVDQAYAGKDRKAVIAPGASMSAKVFTLVGYDAAWRAKAAIKSWARCSEP